MSVAPDWRTRPAAESGMTSLCVRIKARGGGVTLEAMDRAVQAVAALGEAGGFAATGMAPDESSFRLVARRSIDEAALAWLLRHRSVAAAWTRGLASMFARWSDAEPGCLSGELVSSSDLPTGAETTFPRGHVQPLRFAFDDVAEGRSLTLSIEFGAEADVPFRTHLAAIWSAWLEVCGNGFFSDSSCPPVLCHAVDSEPVQSLPLSMQMRAPRWRASPAALDVLLNALHHVDFDKHLIDEVVVA